MAFQDISLNDAGLVFENSGVVDMDGDFRNFGGDEVINNLDGATWRWSGAMFDLDLSLYCGYTGNTFVYDGAGAQDIIPPKDAYWNLILTGSGTKEAQNDLDINGDLTIIGPAEFNVANNNADIDLAGDWTNSGTFAEGTGLVTFDGSAEQTISNPSGEIFYDLEIDGAGISLSEGNVTVTHTLFMTQGNISTGSYRMILGTGLANPGTLFHTSGTVIGEFERWINSFGTGYLFPVGTVGNYRPAIISFNSLSEGSLAGSFISGSPGESGLPLDDDGVSIVHTYDIGYWSLSAENSLSSSDYDLDLDADGFTSPPITEESRLLTRASSGGDWTVDGIHVPATGDTVGRSGISTLPAEYTVGDPSDEEPPVLTAPGPLTAVCDISEHPAYATYDEFTAAGGTATDNYGIDESSFTLLSEESDNNTCPEVVTRIYQISDLFSNTDTAAQTITIDDNIAPTLTGTLPGGAVGNVCIADAPAAPAVADIASQYTDNCGTVTATLIDSEVTGDDCSWTATYTYTVEDECGNSAANAVVVYTGGDTEAPTLTGTLPGGAQGNVCIDAAPSA
ncbi:MAG: hypothetical protein ACQERV_08720, partial [Bacteroidota bacterium]